MRFHVPATVIAAVALTACAKSNAAAADSGKMADSTRSGAAARESAGGAAVDPAAARHAIDSTNASMSRALEKGDVKTIATIYASDAIADFPDAPLASGSDAISKLFNQDFAGAALSDVKISTDGLLTGGDLAVENGTYSWTLTPKSNGKAQKQTGHFLTVWQHQPDGAWKIARDYVTADPAQK